jgi:hypothetical protein
MLWMFQRVNYGTVTNEKNASMKDLSPREWTVLVPIIAAIVLMGVLPNLFLRPIGPSVERMLNQIHQAVPTRIQAEFGIGDSGLGTVAARVALEPVESHRNPPNRESRIPNRRMVSR